LFVRTNRMSGPMPLSTMSVCEKCNSPVVGLMLSPNGVSPPGEMDW
jgi:hypothetical protein